MIYILINMCIYLYFLQYHVNITYIYIYIYMYTYHISRIWVNLVFLRDATVKQALKVERPGAGWGTWG